MKKLLSVTIILLLLGLFGVSTYAIDQSLTVGNYDSSVIEFETNTSKNTSFFISTRIGGQFFLKEKKDTYELYYNDGESSGYGVAIGNKWYFPQAQEGTYIGINVGFQNLYHSDTTIHRVNGPAFCSSIFLGYKQADDFGWPIDLSIGYGCVSNGERSDLGFMFKWTIGFGW